MWGAASLVDWSLGSSEPTRGTALGWGLCPVPTPH